MTEAERGYDDGVDSVIQSETSFSLNVLSHICLGFKVQACVS